MREYSFVKDGVTYKRISKTAAKKAYDAKGVYICPCNIRPFGIWGMGVWVKSSSGEAFEKVVNAFEFYNCNSNETGKYAAFYIQV